MNALLGYISRILPVKYNLKFLFREDFNRDGAAEVLIGYTVFNDPFTDLYILYVFGASEEYDHQLVMSSAEGDWSGNYDSAFLGDLNGDGIQEFVLVLGGGTGHFVTAYVFQLGEDGFKRCWEFPEPCGGGYVYLDDTDGDGSEEIVVNAVGSLSWGKLCEFEVYETFCYKWNGRTFVHQAVESLNPDEGGALTIAGFLYAIWQEDYIHAAQYAFLPTLLGLQGLAGEPVELFYSYARDKIRPALVCNLEQGPLSKETVLSLYGGQLNGVYDSFYCELVREGGALKVALVEIQPRVEMYQKPYPEVH